MIPQTPIPQIRIFSQISRIFHPCTLFLLIIVANKWVGAQPTFLARWRGCRRHLVNLPSACLVTTCRHSAFVFKLATLGMPLPFTIMARFDFVPRSSRRPDSPTDSQMQQLTTELQLASLIPPMPIPDKLPLDTSKQNNSHVHIFSCCRCLQFNLQKAI